jgi:hypothetical protein
MEKQLKDYAMNYLPILKIIEENPELKGFIEYLVDLQEDCDDCNNLYYEYSQLTGELEFLANNQVKGLKVNKDISKELKELIIIHNNNLRIERLKETINK